MDVKTTITVELPIEQADALATFCNRVRWEVFTVTAISDAEARLMRNACGNVQDALAKSGHTPR